MSSRGDVPALKDIVEAISRVERYIGTATLAEFVANTEAQDAVLRNLEVIGEAVKNLSPDFRQEHADVEWSRIAGLRVLQRGLGHRVGRRPSEASEAEGAGDRPATPRGLRINRRARDKT